MNRDQGFTLIEMLVAVGILAVVVVVMASGVTSNLRAAQYTRTSAQAKAYAQSVLEAYRSAWSEVDNYRLKSVPDLSGLPALPAPYQAKAPAVRITDVALVDAAGNDITTAKDTNIVQVRQVEVTVFRDTESAVVLSTRISDPSARKRIR